MGRDNLIARLMGEAEEQYRIFNRKFVLTNRNEMLGVKVPKMRSIAREIAGDDWEDFMRGYGFCVETEAGSAERMPACAEIDLTVTSAATGTAVQVAGQQRREELCRTIFFEEVMIIGMVIDLINVEPARRLSLVEQFVPLIDNWAVCDVFCGGAKWVGEPGRGPKSCNKVPLEQMWKFLQRYLQSSSEFEIRFGVVMLMSYFLTEEYIERVLLQMEKVRKGDYYVDMAVAWCLATARAKFDERTQEFVRNATLTPSVIKKYEQKVRDSLRVKKI